MTSKVLIRTTISLLLLAAIMIGCGGRPALSNLSARELFESGMERYDKKKYFRAIEYFQSLVYDYPGESLVDTAQYYLALSYFGNDDFVLSKVEFARLVNYYPASVYAQHALFMQAVSLFEGAPDNFGLDQSEIREARRRFEDFIIDFPESELLGDVQAYLAKANDRLASKDYQAGVVYYRMHTYEAANIYFQKVIDEYTTSSVAGSALYYMGEINLDEDKYAEAQSNFENFLILHPNHEWVEKAKKKVTEAAFESAKSDYLKEEMSQAKTKLAQFLANYPEARQSQKALKLLEKIGELPDEIQADSTREES